MGGDPIDLCAATGPGRHGLGTNPRRGRGTRARAKATPRAPSASRRRPGGRWRPLPPARVGRGSRGWGGDPIDLCAATGPGRHGLGTNPRRGRGTRARAKATPRAPSASRRRPGGRWRPLPPARVGRGSRGWGASRSTSAPLQARAGTGSARTPAREGDESPGEGDPESPIRVSKKAGRAVASPSPREGGKGIEGMGGEPIDLCAATGPGRHGLGTNPRRGRGTRARAKATPTRPAFRLVVPPLPC